eukprot:gene37856-46712_t
MQVSTALNDYFLVYNNNIGGGAISNDGGATKIHLISNSNIRCGSVHNLLIENDFDHTITKQSAVLAAKQTANRTAINPTNLQTYCTT